MNMQFQTSLPIDQAVRNLQAAIQAPSLAIVDLRLSLHLEGEVTPERVVLYREHGRSTWYGRFEGRFTTDGGATRLIGQFVRKPSGGVASRAGFQIALAGSFAIVAAVRWQSHHEVGWIFGALLAGAVGAGVIWYRRKNSRIEAKLLHQEIAEKLKGPGA